MTIVKTKFIGIFVLFGIFNNPSLSQSTSIIAHRGASSIAPENTLTAFQKAIEIGADYFELDVRASKDDSLMIMHDSIIDRTTNGSGKFKNFTYSQLKSFDAGSWFAKEFSDEKIPTLREALSLALANNVKVCVDIKDYTKTSKIIQLIFEMEAQEKTKILCFSLDILSTVKQLAPTIPVCYMQGSINEEHIGSLKDIGGEIVISGLEGSKSMIEYAHTQGLSYWIWTVNHINDMKSLMNKGVDGFMTDYPQRMIMLQDDTPPPSVNIEEASVQGTIVNLRWPEVTDPESGVDHYEVFFGIDQFDLNFLTSTTDNTIKHNTQMEDASLYYGVLAVNEAGLNSLEFGNIKNVRTELDRQAPKVIRIRSFGSSQQLQVYFNEKVDPVSAENPENYKIDNLISVWDAELGLDSTSVFLSSSNLIERIRYSVTVNGIKDIAQTPNYINELTNYFFHYDYLPDLAAAWQMNENSSEYLLDQSGNDNTGNHPWPRKNNRN